MKICYATILALFAGFALVVFCSGCQQDPKVDDTQFGKVVETLPDLPDRPESFTLPEGVEDKDCPVAEGHVHF